MKRKFKIGDRVKIIGCKETYGLTGFIGSMINESIKEEIGQTAIIKELAPEDIYYVSLENEKKELYISGRMLKLVENCEQITITKRGKTIYANLNNEISFTTENDDFEKGVKVCLKELFSKPKKEEFKPYLAFSESKYKLGFIGEETPLTALFGEELYVGDVVEVFYPGSGHKATEFVAKDIDGYFVMGCKNTTKNLTNGIDKDKTQYRKIKSYKDLKHNEEVEDITAILEEDKEVEK